MDNIKIYYLPGYFIISDYVHKVKNYPVSTVGPDLHLPEKASLPLSWNPPASKKYFPGQKDENNSV